MRITRHDIDGCNIVTFEDGCTVRTGIDGRTIQADMRHDEPEFGPHDFWAHWVEHEAKGEVYAQSAGPNTYGHIMVRVTGL